MDRIILSAWSLESRIYNASEHKMQQLVCVSSGWDLCWPDVFRIGQKTKIVVTDSSKNIWQPFVISHKMTVFHKTNIKFQATFCKEYRLQLKKKVWLHNCSSQYQTGLFHTTCHARPVTNTAVGPSACRTKPRCSAVKWRVVTLGLCAFVNTEWEQTSEPAWIPNCVIFHTTEIYYLYNDYFKIKLNKF